MIQDTNMTNENVLSNSGLEYYDPITDRYEKLKKQLEQILAN